MKSKEVHKLSNEEIDVELTRLRRKLFDLTTQSITEKIEDVSQFSKARKDVARLLTESTTRARAAGTPGSDASPRREKRKRKATLT